MKEYAEHLKLTESIIEIHKSFKQMKIFIIVGVIFLLSSCGGNEQVIHDVTTDPVGQNNMVSDSLRKEHEMMRQRIDFCREIYSRPLMKHNFRACITGYLAQPIPR